MAAGIINVGVLALQGGFSEHLAHLRRASQQLEAPFSFLEVRNQQHLSRCDALIIPGGESTTMAIVAARLELLEPLRRFVKVDRKPVWGTCAGLVLLAEEASATKKGGQELIGGLNIKVQRNSYGRQTESFVADLDLPFLKPVGSEASPFRGVFIRAPIVEEVLPTADTKASPIEILGVVTRPKSSVGEVPHTDANRQEGDDVIAVKQDNVFGISFHPELTDDIRIHQWWLGQVLDRLRGQ